MRIFFLCKTVIANIKPMAIMFKVCSRMGDIKVASLTTFNVTDNSCWNLQNNIQTLWLDTWKYFQLHFNSPLYQFWRSSENIKIEWDKFENEHAKRMFRELFQNFSIGSFQKYFCWFGEGNFSTKSKKEFSRNSREDFYLKKLP